MVFEMMKGEQLAIHHRSINEATAEDNAPLGWWWSGTNRYAVDNAILVSPNMASRWMGYLNQSEHWTYAELRSRWDDLSRKLQDKVTFVVQLSSFPKVDPLELGVAADADLRSLETGRCILTYEKPISRTLVASDNLTTHGAEGTVDCQVTPLTRLSNDDWMSLLRPYWTTLAPDFSSLAPESMKPPSRYDFCLGDYHTEYLLVQAPLSEEMAKSPAIKLHMLGGRERTAVFPLIEKPKAKRR